MIAPDQIYICMCICTDNGSNMIKMVKMMGDCYISKDDASINYQDGELADESDSEDEDFEQVDDMFNCVDINIENFIDTMLEMTG